MILTVSVLAALHSVLAALTEKWRISVSVMMMVEDEKQMVPIAQAMTMVHHLNKTQTIFFVIFESIRTYSLSFILNLLNF